MNCTCFDRKYPCPVHAPGHLPVVELVERAVFVIRLFQRWPVDGEKRWFATVTKDCVHVFSSTERPNASDAIWEATEWLHNTNPRPKEK